VSAFLYYEAAKRGRDDDTNPFAGLHCTIDPEKYGKDIQRRNPRKPTEKIDRDRHFDSELADLLILLKEYFLTRDRDYSQPDPKKVLRESWSEMKKRNRHRP
jgi:hypothetical protein